jgi:hypothetical protein
MVGKKYARKVKMKNRKRIIYPYGSPMAKSLQRWKELWREKPEVMESLRQRGVQKKKKADWRYKVWISDIFEYKVGETELNPGRLSKIIYAILKDRKENGRRFMKIKSLKRYLVKHKIIKYDIERDLYFNLILIEKQNRKAERERAIEIEREAERIKSKPETNPETSEEKIGRLMKYLEAKKECLAIQERNVEPPRHQHEADDIERFVANFKDQIAKTEAEILRLQSLTEKPAISA